MDDMRVITEKEAERLRDVQNDLGVVSFFTFESSKGERTIKFHLDNDISSVKVVLVSFSDIRRLLDVWNKKTGVNWFVNVELDGHIVKCFYHIPMNILESVYIYYLSGFLKDL